MRDWYGDSPGWGSWFMMMLIMVAFWALLVLGAMALYRTFRDDQRPPPGRDSAEQVLRERFARGEIDDEQYARQLAVLGSATTLAGPGLQHL
jgi:putative membrane protein